MNVKYRYGTQQLVRVPVDSAKVIAAGDLVFLDSGMACAAQDFPWNVALVTTQADFAAQFLGVALEPSASGEDDPISVDISPHSVYEFDVASGTYDIGDSLGPDEDDSELMSRQLETALATSSIARAVERKSSATTSLNVSFASAYATASANANAQLG